MNLRFSLSKTLRVERLVTLDVETIIFFSNESSIEEDEEEEEEDESQAEGSWLK